MLSQHCHLFFKLLHAYWLLFFRIGLGIVRSFSSAFYSPSAFSYPRFMLHPHFLIRVSLSIRIFSSAFYPPSAFSHPYFLIPIRIRHPYPHPYPRFIPTHRICGENQGSKFPLFRYSENSKMPGGIVNFMITVFRLYSRKNCGTTCTMYRQGRVVLLCNITAYALVLDFFYRSLSHCTVQLHCYCKFLFA